MIKYQEIEHHYDQRKMRFWYGLYIFFCLYNLKLLIDDKYSVSYQTGIETDSLNEIKLLVCTPFSTIKFENQLKFESNLDKVTINQFLNFSIKSIENRLNISNYFDIKKSHISFQRFCFPVNKTELEADRRPLNKFLQVYDIYFYFYSFGKHPFVSEYVYRKKDSGPFFVLNGFIHKVHYEETLESKYCTLLNHDKFNRFNCQNECYKKIEKNDIFHYHYNEDFNLSLSYISNRTFLDDQINENSFDLFFSNPNYKKCWKQCSTISCFRETYNYEGVERVLYDLTKRDKPNKINIVREIYLPYYSTNYFYLQFIGLITMFTGTSIVKTMPFFINLWAIKMKKFHQIELIFSRCFSRFFSKFKLILNMSCFLIFLIISCKMLADYQFESDNPKKHTIYDYNFEIEPLSARICFPIETLIFNDSKIEKNRNSLIIKNYTFKEIEKDTNDKWKSKLKEFTLYLYGDEIGVSLLYEMDYKVSDDVLFKNCKFEDLNILTRCFRFDINIKVERYKDLVSIFNLYFEFADSYWKIYFIDLEITSDSMDFHENFIGKTTEIKFSKYVGLSCMNYHTNETYNCLSRMNCYDMCINQQFISNNSMIPMNSVINKNQLDTILLSNIKFSNNKIDNETRKYCDNEFKLPDCNRTFYFGTYQTEYDYDNMSVYFNLNYLQIDSIQNAPSELNLYLNILNVISILFGSNVSSLIIVFFHGLKRIFRFKWRKIYNLIIFGFCLIGLSLHVYYIFNGIITQQLQGYSFFKTVKNYQLPLICPCFIENEIKIDVNHKLNGHYLDEISELKYNDVFDEISYNVNNKNNSWKTLNMSSIESHYKEISISHFYFLDLKCFQIDLKQLVNEKNFVLSRTRNFLKIKLNKNLHEKKYLYFHYKQRNSEQLYGNYQFKIGPIKPGSNQYHKYELTFEEFRVKKDDKFAWIKEFRSLFVKRANIHDTDEYIGNMKRTLNNYNLTTKDAILESKNFEKNINDELFEQLFLQVQNVSDYSNPVTSNYEKSFFFMFGQKNTKPTEEQSDFKISFNLLTRQTVFTNKDNWASVIQSLLSAASFWLNLTIMDCFVYLNHLLIPFKQIYKIIIRLNIHSKNTIDSCVL